MNEKEARTKVLIEMFKSGLLGETSGLDLFSFLWPSNEITLSTARRAEYDDAFEESKSAEAVCEVDETNCI